jgi:hypothetical protein
MLGTAGVTRWFDILMVAGKLDVLKCAIAFAVEAIAWTVAAMWRPCAINHAEQSHILYCCNTPSMGYPFSDVKSPRLLQVLVLVQHYLFGCEVRGPDSHWVGHDVNRCVQGWPGVHPAFTVTGRSMPSGSLQEPDPLNQPASTRRVCSQLQPARLNRA